MTDYSRMSDTQLDKEKQRLDKNRAAIKGEMKQITEEQDRRATDKKLAGMSEKEKDNLRQALGTDGIKSEEKVGKPEI